MDRRKVVNTTSLTAPELNGLIQIHLPKDAQLASISINPDKNFVVLKVVTIKLNGQILPRRCIIAFKESLTKVYITRLDATSFEELTKEITTMLTPYGTILDITFKASGNFLTGKVQVLMDVKKEG
ncbi:hypothetical protein IWW47_001925 [Coemansia sp. RSA 2052]|nr:hypothetical protein IWW47_001925 [Coemansia sp. RSA 2052]